jgi:hypothetical protein
MKTVTELAQQIADQELEACCKWLDAYHTLGPSPMALQLRTARRPPTIPETIEVDGHTYRLVK